MVNITHPSFELIDCPDGMKSLRLIEECARTSYKSKSKLLELWETNPEEAYQKAMDIIKSKYNRFGRNYYDAYWLYFKTDLTPADIQSQFEIVKDASALDFVESRLLEGHTIILEYVDVIVRLFVNIGYAREQNRHRHLTIIEQSTRYANFSDKSKFNGQLQVVNPIWFFDAHENPEIEPQMNYELAHWEEGMTDAEESYMSCVSRLTRYADKIQDPIRKAKFIKGIPQMARGYLPLDTRTEEVVKGNLREWSEVIFRLRASPYAHPSMQEIMYPLKLKMRSLFPVVFDYDITIQRTLSKD